MRKLYIIVTVPVVLETWLKGQPNYLSHYYDVTLITSKGSSVDAIAQREGVSVNILDFNRKINLWQDLKVLVQLVLLLAKNRPDIVYTLTPKAGLLGMIAGWMARVRIRVHSVVGLPSMTATGKRKWILNITERITYFFATNLYSNSLNLKQYINNYLTEKTVEVIANGSVNGVDTDYYQQLMTNEQIRRFRHQHLIAENAFVITYVGRIVKDKGINELVESFVKLNEKISQIQLLLIGDFEDELDPIEPKTKELIETVSCIKHLPFQHDIVSFFSISDLCVLPSHREGLPNVLIEAGSVGIPLLATDINGSNEIIMDGVNGKLVPLNDKKALLDAMMHFVIDENYYKSIKINVRESILQRYEQNYFWNELYKHFHALEKELL